MAETKGKSVQLLSLASVDKDTSITDGSVKDAAMTMAVLQLHAKLQEMGNGKSAKSITELLAEYTNMSNTLLRAYISSFGSHGVQVIERYIARQNSKSQQLYECTYKEAVELITGTTGIRLT